MSARDGRVEFEVFTPGGRVGRVILDEDPVPAGDLLALAGLAVDHVLRQSGGGGAVVVVHVGDELLAVVTIPNGGRGTRTYFHDGSAVVRMKNTGAGRGNNAPDDANPFVRAQRAREGWGTEEIAREFGTWDLAPAIAGSAEGAAQVDAALAELDRLAARVTPEQAERLRRFLREKP